VECFTPTAAREELMLVVSGFSSTDLAETAPRLIDEIVALILIVSISSL
jgi:hypothetical protein